MAATWRLFPTLTQSALWFLNGGIVLVFTGVLNLINRAHGAGARSLRWFCQGVNLVMLCFAALAGVVGKASAAELAVVLTLIGAITLLSALQPALNPLALNSRDDG